MKRRRVIQTLAAKTTGTPATEEATPATRVKNRREEKEFLESERMLKTQNLKRERVSHP